MKKTAVPLEEICEFEYEREIKISGFAKNDGQWMEYTFGSAKIEVINL